MADVSLSRTSSKVALDIHAIAYPLETGLVGHCSGRSSESGRR